MAHPQLSQKHALDPDILQAILESKASNFQQDVESFLSYTIVKSSSSSQELQTKCLKKNSTTSFRYPFLSTQNLTLQIVLVALRALIFCNLAIIASSASSIYRARMVRLCIASVDPVKLSSQCVMCNRREFPLTVIDCTGITKMNDLIASPLNVQDATCLIYNCRRQVPDIKPEPYHGTAAVRANYPSASGIRTYEMVPPVNMYGSYSGSHPNSRYTGFGSTGLNGFPISTSSSSIMGIRQQLLPFTLTPASSYTTPFSKAANMDY